MSGGHFDYVQDRIRATAEEVEKLLAHPDYPQHIKQEFVNCQIYLIKAAIYLQRVDWLVSGDDGEKEFLSRLRSNLAEVECLRGTERAPLTDEELRARVPAGMYRHSWIAGWRACEAASQEGGAA